MDEVTTDCFDRLDVDVAVALGVCRWAVVRSLSYTRSYDENGAAAVDEYLGLAKADAGEGEVYRWASEADMSIERHPHWRHHVPRYSTDPGAMARLLNAMAERGWYLYFWHCSPEQQKFEGLPPFVAGFGRAASCGTHTETGEFERADSMPRAVAEAALTTLTGKVKLERDLEGGAIRDSQS